MSAQQWILRRGSKRSGFRYTGPDGAPVRSRATLERIEALRIPPAWRDVHIAASSRARIQAWGLDDAGRRQYRYHQRAVERGARRKYYRVRALGRDLPRIRRAVSTACRERELTRDKVCAAVVRLVEEGFFRLGHERYAREHGTYGAATLRKDHVDIDGDTVVFHFEGKGDVEQRHTVVDRELARILARLRRTPGAPLFRYREAGEWHDLTAGDVNAYLRRVLDVPYTAKDFRTWGGTLRAATVLADIGEARSEREARKNVTLAVRLVAAELGNTPTICRQSYIHPAVIERYIDAGETIAGDLRGRRSARRRDEYTPEERALLRFLDRHFPDRRRRPREELAAAS